MPSLVLSCSNRPRDLPDALMSALAAGLARLDEAKPGDIVAVTFHYTPGRYDCTLAPQVRALSMTEDGLDDVAWSNLDGSARAAVAAIAMTAFEMDGNINLLSRGVDVAWPDTDDADGVEVHLFRNGATTTLPIGCDDLLAYGSKDVPGAIVTTKPASAHDRVGQIARQNEVMALWRRCYSVEVPQKPTKRSSR